MNKTEYRTYLYKEVDNYIKELGLKDLVIICYNENRKSETQKSILYILEPMLFENINLYNKLFKNKWSYIIQGDFNKMLFNNNYYTNILNVPNKYSVYAIFKDNISEESKRNIISYIAILIADDVVVNKVINIKNGFKIIDIALDRGKDVYAIPGDIFSPKSWLANFVIKQGATPICSMSDIEYILLQKHYKRI